MAKKWQNSAQDSTEMKLYQIICTSVNALENRLTVLTSYGSNDYRKIVVKLFLDKVLNYQFLVSGQSNVSS